VLNHSYTSSDVRFGVPVTVAYDADVAKAMALMVEVARREKRVLPDPKGPAAFLVRFGESGIELELGVWINDPENGQLALRSALNQGVLAAFREHGITIPFPQREVRVVNAAELVRGDVPAAPKPTPKP
jgi:small-conductance mechanosensitive channel